MGQALGFGLLLAIVMAMLFAVPVFVILVAGMVPTAVAYYVDRDREKYAAISVGATNLAGVLPYLLQLWTATFALQPALLMLSNPFTWLIMYAAAAAGWGLYLALPSVAAVYLDIVADSRSHALRKERRQLLKEWGKSIDPAADGQQR